MSCDCVVHVANRLSHLLHHKQVMSDLTCHVSWRHRFHLNFRASHGRPNISLLFWWLLFLLWQNLCSCQGTIDTSQTSLVTCKTRNCVSILGMREVYKFSWVLMAFNSTFQSWFDIKNSIWSLSTIVLFLNQKFLNLYVVSCILFLYLSLHLRSIVCVWVLSTLVCQ